MSNSKYVILQSVKRGIDKQWEPDGRVLFDVSSIYCAEDVDDDVSLIRMKDDKREFQALIKLEDVLLYLSELETHR